MLKTKMLSTFRNSVIKQALKHTKIQCHLSSAFYVTDVAITSQYKGSIIPYLGDGSAEKVQLRREWVEQYTGSSLRNMADWYDQDHHPNSILNSHVEMPIGLAKVPLAVAGPLQINGTFAQGSFLAPLAITEGAVVASTTRGAAALNKSGGVTAYTSQMRTSGCPVFEAVTPEDANGLGKWVKSQLSQIQQEVLTEFGSDINLTDILCMYDLQFVYFVLNYETSASIEHEKAKVVSEYVTKWIAQKAPKDLQLRRYWNESNLSGQNRCSKLNMMLGYGISCGAEAILTEDILQKSLGVSSEGLRTLWMKAERWSDRGLSMGSNGNPANIIGAIFAATGQDLANCVDSSACKTQFTVNEGPGGGLKYTLWIPSLVISSHLNGSDLPAQRQCLEMMGCYGPNKVRKIAEIIASFSIALDISTISSVEAGQFTKAHEKLGKNRPT